MKIRKNIKNKINIFEITSHVNFSYKSNCKKKNYIKTSNLGNDSSNNNSRILLKCRNREIGSL